MMKVAIITNDLSVMGGTHKQILRLAQYLNENGIEFSIFTKYYNPQGTYKEFSQFDVISLHNNCETNCNGLLNKISNNIKRIIDCRKLYKLIPKDVSLINVHDNGMSELIKMAKRNGKPVVWQINDIDYSFRVGVHKDIKRSFISVIKSKIIAKKTQNVDVITVNVSKNAQRVKECLNKKARVLYCGVDVNERLIKHEFSGDKDIVRILTVGVFYFYRNYETLIEITKELNRRGVSATVDIIGKTDSDLDYYSRINNLIKFEGLSNQITIWGAVDDVKYVELFNDADIFSFLNIEQSWGLAVFEAMSAGLPALVSNSVGATELLHNNEDSIIVNPKDVNEICDAIERLKTDRAFYNRISDTASLRVKEYTWDKLYSSGMLNIFKELVGEN